MLVWAKVKEGAGGMNRFHAWRDGRGACPSVRDATPSRYQRERQPLRACGRCLAAMQREAAGQTVPAALAWPGVA